jgi:hypothetical protein
VPPVAGRRQVVEREARAAQLQVDRRDAALATRIAQRERRQPEPSSAERAAELVAGLGHERGVAAEPQRECTCGAKPGKREQPPGQGRSGGGGEREQVIRNRREQGRRRRRHDIGRHWTEDDRSHRRDEQRVARGEACRDGRHRERQRRREQAHSATGPSTSR